ncbi:MAG: glycosyltransferase [Nitrospirae bacterium]|nr:glycosyltransferase [Nitrospirota bacterium]
MKGGRAPEVTVIIPGYNCARYVRECIETILAQSYKNLEIVFVDDGSTDDTPKVVQSFKDAVRYFRRDRPSGGPFIPRNVAIRASRGRYIALIDADDRWLPEKLDRQMEVFGQNPDLGLVYSDSYCYREGRRISRCFDVAPPHRGHVFPDLLVRNFIPGLTPVIPRSVFDAIGLFDERFRTAGDYEYWIRVSRHYPVDFVGAPLAEYRLHADNLSWVYVELQYQEVMTIFQDLLREHPRRIAPHKAVILEHWPKWHRAMARHHFRKRKMGLAVLFYSKYVLKILPGGSPSNNIRSAASAN